MLALRPLSRVLSLAVLVVMSCSFLPQAASADSSRWLPGQAGYGDMVVDEAGGHVFISSGKQGSRILVRNLDGSPASTIASMPGATGMVLQGTTLYVALCEQSALAVIDTTTLTEVERIPVAPVTVSGTCDLALVSGRLWFPTKDQHADIASVTVATPHAVVADAVGPTIYNPIFPTATTPPTSLIVGTSGLSPSTWYTFNVGVSPATQATSGQTGSNLRDGALTANGQHVVAASGSPYYGQRFQVPAITPAGTYTTDAYPNAAAVTPDGAWVVIGRDSSTRDIYVFGSGSPASVREFDLGTGLRSVPNGLRITSDAARIYAIGVDSSSPSRYVLNTYDSPTTGTLQPPAPFVAASPVAGAAPGSSAQFTLGGGMQEATDIAVDAANGRVFVAPGRTGTGIAVRNLDGTSAGTIADEPGATSMVLHGGKLYVTLCGWNAIDVIDLATLTRTERIDLGANVLDGNCALGLANGRLFYPDSDQWVSVTSVSVASPHTFVTNALGSTRYEPVFGTSPAQPNRLLVAETGISTTTVDVFDVGTSSMTPVSTRDISGYASDLAHDAQGTTLGVMMRDVRTSDAAIVATYSGSGTMAYSPDGNWVASLGWNSSGPDVSVFARGDNAPRRQFEVVGSSGDAYPAIAFSPTADRLYAVVSPSWSTPAPTLHVIDAPTAAGAAYADFTSPPSLTGSQAQGATLSCSAGAWSAAPTFTYTWFRDATLIGGATASTYATTATDAGKAVRCVVRATTAAGSVSAPSPAITVIAPPTNQAVPSISGSPTVGSTLTCAPGTWAGSPTFDVAWRRNGTPIPLATSSTYVVDAADGGTTITCTVTATNPGGTASATSTGIAVAGAPANSVAPSITGVVSPGFTIQCGAGTWSGAPTYSYGWTRDGDPIAAQASATYVVDATDLGTTIRCVVTATNASGSNTATSAGIVAAMPAPTSQTPPTISGYVLPGSTLTCASGSWSDASTYAYEWRRNGTAIPGSAGTTYVLGVADYGSSITCAVTATGPGGSTTASSAGVSIGGTPLNTVLPTVTGATTVGSTLQCAPGTWTNTPTFTFAWLRNGSAIDGQAASSYVVTAADAGASIGCRVTASNTYGSNVATSAGVTATTPPVAPTPGIEDPDDPDPDGSGPDDTAPDTTGPVIRLGATPHRLADALRRGFRLKVGCNETCTVRFGVQVDPRAARRLRVTRTIASRASITLVNGRSASLVARFSRANKTRLAKAAPLPVTIRVTATDEAGNTTVKLLTMTLTR